MKKFINASLPTLSNAFKKVQVLFDEKIIKISADDIVTEEQAELIDLEGAILLPGAVDAHTHYLSNDQDSAEAIRQLSGEALKGGWTTLAEMSFRSPKPIFELDDIAEFKALVNENSFVDMALWGNVNISDYPYHAEAAQLLWTKGVVGISLFSPSPNPALQEMSFTEIMDLFMDIYESDTSFAFQGYDTETDASYSFDSQRAAVKKLLRRMQENPIHIPRISSWASIEFINSISKRSDISFSLSMADFVAHYAKLPNPANQSCDFDDYGAEIFELLKTNKLYMLSNNVSSQLCEGDELFCGAPLGLISGSYAWVLSELWKNRKVPLATCLKMVSENPAKRLGLYPVKGCLEAGSDADFVIYDPNSKSELKLSKNQSIELNGAIKKVYLRGKEVFDGTKIKTNEGRFLTRQANPKRRHNKTTWI